MLKVQTFPFNMSVALIRTVVPTKDVSMRIKIYLRVLRLYMFIILGCDLIK